MTLVETTRLLVADSRLDALSAGAGESVLLLLSDTLPSGSESPALSEPVQTQSLFSGHFVLAQAMQAYETFGQAMREHALKVIITADE